MNRTVLAVVAASAFYFSCVNLTPPWQMVDARAPTGGSFEGRAPDSFPGDAASSAGEGGTWPGAGDTGGTSQAGGTAEIGPVSVGGNSQNDNQDGSADVSIVTLDLPSLGGSGGTIPGSGGVPASGGVRDSASLSGGGTGGTGGSATTTTTTEDPPVLINCANPVVPDNGNPPSNGVVTDFSHWDPASPVLGRSANLSGTLFKNAASDATIGEPKVEGNPPGMHLAGSLPVLSTGGGGLQFTTCAMVTSFNFIRFTYYGGAPGCRLDLLIHTFSESTVGGGCRLDGGGNCNDFPRLNGIVDVSTPSSLPTPVTKPLSSFKPTTGSWSTTDARQVVGIEWRFTNAGTGSPCSLDFTVTNVAFLP